MSSDRAVAPGGLRSKDVAAGGEGWGAGLGWGGNRQDHALLKGLFDQVHKASSMWISSRAPVLPCSFGPGLALTTFPFILLHLGFPKS